MGADMSAFLSCFIFFSSLGLVLCQQRVLVVLLELLTAYLLLGCSAMCDAPCLALVALTLTAAFFLFLLLGYKFHVFVLGSTSECASTILALCTSVQSRPQGLLLLLLLLLLLRATVGATTSSGVINVVVADAVADSAGDFGYDVTVLLQEVAAVAGRRSCCCCCGGGGGGGGSRGVARAAHAHGVALAVLERQREGHGQPRGGVRHGHLVPGGGDAREERRARHLEIIQRPHP